MARFETVITLFERCHVFLDKIGLVANLSWYNYQASVCHSLAHALRVGGRLVVVILPSQITPLCSTGGRLTNDHDPYNF